MTKTTPLVFVLYDGIEHSVFDGQVLDPLLKKLAHTKELQITLVSFEKKMPNKKKQNELKNAHPRLTIIIFRKTFFLGALSLNIGAWQLHSYLRTLKTYQLMARGPLAGIIAQKAVNKKCTRLILQARGLLAKEHEFAHTKTSVFTKWLYRLRTRHLAYWEKQAYTYQAAIPFSIQTVSTALKQYLISEYNLFETHFIAEQPEDTPNSIKPAQRTTLRSTLREKLKIKPHRLVYVYNGSAKPWQCPHETVLFFKEQLKKQKDAFLLLLTPDIKLFKKICKKEKLPPCSYKIITVSHRNVMSYLCVADRGILLREKNIINWVSRPTKYLEYKAAGLSVIHNHTVACIAQEG